MKNLLKIIYLFISSIRLIPHLLIYNLHKNKAVIKYDVTRWIKTTNNIMYEAVGFLYLMTFYPEFRNLFYHRIGLLSYFISFLCPKMNTLFINTPIVGPGLFIQHGFATIIAAKSIGKDCWINQQVTVGFSNDTDCPIIQDNVVINAGAKIIGNVTVGSNSIVGANAVVVKNVPENCSVAGIPAYIIRKNGIKINEKLK